MFPDQIAIIKEFMPKFGCIQQNIIDFIRGNRLYDEGVEDKQCCTGEHHMKIGETAYVFNGKPFGLSSIYCSELRCFLNGLDKSTVRKYIKLIVKKPKKKKKVKIE